MDQQPHGSDIDHDREIHTETQGAQEKSPVQEHLPLDEQESAGTARSSRKALARTFRQTGRIVSLSADVSDSVASFVDSEKTISGIIPGAGAALNRISQVLDDIGSSLSSLDSVNDKVRSAIDIHIRLVERAAETMNDHADMFETYETMQREGRDDGSTDEIVGACRKSVEKLGAFSRHVSELAEKADVVSLNLLLEAGKTESERPGYSVVAAQIRKVVADAEQYARDINTIYNGMAENLDSAVSLLKKKVDQAQIIDTKKKELKESLGRDADRIQSLRSEAESITASAGWLDAGILFQYPLPGELARTVDTIVERIERIQTTASAFVDTEGRIVDLSDTLAESSARIMPDNSLTETLDAVIAAADDLNHACEYPLDSLDKGLAESTEILSDTKKIADSIRNSSDNISGLSQKTAGTLEAVRSQSRVIKELTGNRTGYRAVLQELITAHQTPVADGRTPDTFLKETMRSLDHLYRIAERIGFFGEKLDLLAVMGNLEVLHSGETESGFALLPKSVETVSAEFCALGKNLLSLEAELGNVLSSLSRSIIPAEKASLDSELSILRAMSAPAMESSAVFHPVHESPESIISGQHRHIVALGERTGSARTAAETACDHLENVYRIIREKRGNIEQIMKATERISSVGSDLYPQGE